MIRSLSRMTTAGSAETTESSRTLHIVLQGQSGVGKTVVALLLSQCIGEAGTPAFSVDTGSVHGSLSDFSGAPAERLSILSANTRDVRGHDGFITTLKCPGADVVMDTDARAFVPIRRYLSASDVAARMTKAGLRLVLHVVVIGGPAMADTMTGLTAVARDCPPDIRVVVWLNEFFGPVIGDHGEPFEALPAYEANRTRIFALVRLARPGEQAAADLQALFARRETFARALAPENTQIHRVQKSRLFRIRQELWPQIGRVL